MITVKLSIQDGKKVVGRKTIIYSQQALSNVVEKVLLPNLIKALEK